MNSEATTLRGAKAGVVVEGAEYVEADPDVEIEAGKKEGGGRGS